MANSLPAATVKGLLEIPESLHAVLSSRRGCNTNRHVTNLNTAQQFQLEVVSFCKRTSRPIEKPMNIQ